MPTRYSDVVAVAHDAEHYSSVEVSVAPVPMSYDEGGNRLRSIIATDAPLHAPERRMILPFFSPKAVLKYEDRVPPAVQRLHRSLHRPGPLRRRRRVRP